MHVARPRLILAAAIFGLAGATFGWWRLRTHPGYESVVLPFTLLGLLLLPVIIVSGRRKEPRER